MLKEFYKAFSYAERNHYRVYPEPREGGYILVYEKDGKPRSSGKIYTKQEYDKKLKEFYIYLYKKHKDE